MGEFAALPPEDDNTRDFEPRRRLRLPVRWQWIVLSAGLVMIVFGVIYILTSPRPDSDDGDVEQVQTVDFVEDQVYSEAFVGMPRYVNPLLVTSQVDRDLVALVYSGLTRIDDYGQPVPDLAKSWDVSADGLTYTFYLHENVTWHDGQSFTADDVAFTMSILRDSEFTGRADLGQFWRSVETYADDDYTVRFFLTQPLAAFPEYAGIGILPAHLLAGVDTADLIADDFNLAPVGTGRLKWVSASIDDDVLTVNLEPFAEYYDPARRVQMDEMKLIFFPDRRDAFRALGSEVQAFGDLTPAQLNAVLGSGGLNLYSARRPAYAAVIFNQQSPERLPFFTEILTRRALSQAVNRAGLVDEYLSRQAVVADSPIMPGSWAFSPSVTPPPYDPLAAMDLLNEAGWITEGSGRSREGIELAFSLLVSDGELEQAVGQSLVDQWQAVGVNVTLEILPPSDLIQRLQNSVEGSGRDFDAALVVFNQGGIADPDPYTFWHETQVESGQNYSGVADRDISEALEIARKDSNGVRRAELYRQFQSFFVDHAVAVLLYSPVYNFTASCQLQGINLMIYTDPSDRYRNMHEWSIAPPEDRATVCPEY